MTPFKGSNRVTSPFGPRQSPITGLAENHKGQDITAAGAWPGEAWLVRECTGGTVLRVTRDRWRGNYVDVQTAPGVLERYQHLHEIYVEEGQAAPQGAVLAMAGSSGDSTGVHLHFEVQKNGSALNPEAWSEVPNQKGSHPGNDNLDAAPAPAKAKDSEGCGACLAQVERKLDDVAARLAEVQSALAGILPGMKAPAKEEA